MASETKAVVVQTLLPYAIGGVFLLAGLWYLGKKFGAGTPDPGGGRPSTGIVDGLLNHTLEIGKSPMTYTDALSQTVMHPVNTIESIFGFNPTEVDSAASIGASVMTGEQSIAQAASTEVGKQFLSRGSAYSFLYNCPRQADPLEGDVAQYIDQNVANVSDITVTLPTTSTLIVSFTYVGDGSDKVATLSAVVMHAMADNDSNLANATFLQVV